MIYKCCLERGEFPREWKKAYVVPVYQRNRDTVVYLPVSLLPVCGKIFERLPYNSLFHFLIENDLISPVHSGFRPLDSCINQLLSITHEI